MVGCTSNGVRNTQGETDNFPMSRIFSGRPGNFRPLGCEKGDVRGSVSSKAREIFEALRIRKQAILIKWIELVHCWKRSALHCLELSQVAIIPDTSGSYNRDWPKVLDLVVQSEDPERKTTAVVSTLEPIPFQNRTQSGDTQSGCRCTEPICRRRARITERSSDYAGVAYGQSGSLQGTTPRQVLQGDNGFLGRKGKQSIRPDQKTEQRILYGWWDPLLPNKRGRIEPRAIGPTQVSLVGYTPQHPRQKKLDWLI